MSLKRNLTTFILCLSVCFCLTWHDKAWSQSGDPNAVFDSVEEDLNVGGDIFNDFNEDLEASQVVEDERFYRYGRFFTFNLGLGITRFTGNRGRAYKQHLDPSFNISLAYFFNFHTSFLIGLQYSKHTAFSDTVTQGHAQTPVGAIDSTFLRPFIGFRYYMDTSDYGNAITYSNPYSTIKIAYWYQNNKFPETIGKEDESGGGIGIGLGFGFEFPIRIKEAYFNVEFTWNWVSFFDKFTKNYAATTNSDPTVATFDDLTGNAWDIFISYNLNW